MPVNTARSSIALRPAYFRLVSWNIVPCREVRYDLAAYTAPAPELSCQGPPPSQTPQKTTMKPITKRFFLAVLAAALLVPGARLLAQTTDKRQQFIYILRVTAKFHEANTWTDKEHAIVGRHFKRLSKAAEAGQVILAGRTSESLDRTFGVVIFEAENEEAARQFMTTDPAVEAGIMSATLHSYAVALQRKQ